MFHSWKGCPAGEVAWHLLGDERNKARARCDPSRPADRPSRPRVSLSGPWQAQSRSRRGLSGSRQPPSCSDWSLPGCAGSLPGVLDRSLAADTASRRRSDRLQRQPASLRRERDRCSRYGKPLAVNEKGLSGCRCADFACRHEVSACGTGNNQVPGASSARSSAILPA